MICLKINRMLRTAVVVISVKVKYKSSFNASLGSNFNLMTAIRIRNGGKIIVGRIKTNQSVSLLANGGIITIGDSVSFNNGCMIVSHDQIDIGDGCIFGPNVAVYDHDHVFDGEKVFAGKYKTTPVTIGNNCWIGANCTILRGSNIGEGCVIGAGTVVKGDIPAHSIVTANRDLKIVPIDDNK